MSNKAKIIAGACGIVGIAAIVIVLLFSGSKTYTVSFDTDGGSHIPMQTVKKGEKANKPSDPTKEEYSFVRWEYQNKEYDFTSSVENDMTLKAIWEKEVQVQKYKITFNVDGKTKTIEVSETSEINLEDLGFEEKNGYALKWYVDGKEYNFTEPLTSDMSIEGKYEKTTNYTVKFNSNGGSKVNNQTISSGGKATEPTDVKKEGYILDGWYLNNKKYDFNTVVSENITLTAKWSEDPNVKRYEVKFNSDGGSSVSSQRIIENKTASQPKNPTKSGYAFEGWYLGNTEYNFSSKVTSNITLTAKWRELQKFTVSFDTDGGSSVATQTVYEGSEATKPSNPTKSEYAFEGWYLGNTKYDFSSKVTSNITLTAKWRELQKFTVSFDTDGGSSVATQTVYGGSEATKPSNPTKSGYAFEGWYLGNTEYNFSSKVTSNITLTAKWRELQKFTVSFDTDGGSSVATQTVYEGSKATKPSNPTKNNNDFVKWTLDGSEYKFDKEVTKNITLVAVWKERTHTYSVTATKVDNFSTDSKLVVKKDGAVVNASSISYIKKPSGSIIWEAGDGELSVATREINGLSSLKVIFTSGEEVTASLTIN